MQSQVCLRVLCASGDIKINTFSLLCMLQKRRSEQKYFFVPFCCASVEVKGEREKNEQMLNISLMVLVRDQSNALEFRMSVCNEDASLRVFSTYCSNFEKNVSFIIQYVSCINIDAHSYFARARAKFCFNITRYTDKYKRMRQQLNKRKGERNSSWHHTKVLNLTLLKAPASTARPEWYTKANVKHFLLLY